MISVKINISEKQEGTAFSINMNSDEECFSLNEFAWGLQPIDLLETHIEEKTLKRDFVNKAQEELKNDDEYERRFAN